MKYTLEVMGDEHRQQVIAIYNYFVENTFAAYPETPVDDSVFDRFQALSHGYPALVVKDRGVRVIGFAYLQAYHPADSFRKTAVASYFILPEHTGKGIGKIILQRFIEESKERAIDTILANVSSLNPGSINFHKKNGFIQCGHFEDIGTKARKSFGVVWMKLCLKNTPDGV